MAIPRVVVREQRSERALPPKVARGATGLLSIVGAVLAVAALLDFGLTWIPFGFGNPEWEFGTVAATLNGLPLLTIALALTLFDALQAGRVWQARLTSVVFAALVLVVLGSAFLYVTDVPLALKAVSNPLAAQGLKKGIVKGCSLILLFTVLYTWLAVRGWREPVRR